MRWRVRSSHPAPVPETIAFIERLTERGDNGKEAIRALKRRLSDVAYRAVFADLDHATSLATFTYRPAAA